MMYMYTYPAQSIILTRVSHGSGGTIYQKSLLTATDNLVFIIHTLEVHVEVHCIEVAALQIHTCTCRCWVCPLDS